MLTKEFWGRSEFLASLASGFLFAVAADCRSDGTVFSSLDNPHSGNAKDDPSSYSKGGTACNNPEALCQHQHQAVWKKLQGSLVVRFRYYALRHAILTCLSLIIFLFPYIWYKSVHEKLKGTYPVIIIISAANVFWVSYYLHNLYTVSLYENLMLRGCN